MTAAKERSVARIGVSWHCCSRVLLRGIVRESIMMVDGKSIRWMRWFLKFYAHLSVGGITADPYGQIFNQEEENDSSGGHA